MDGAEVALMDLPFYLPTSGGDLSCVASIPEFGELKDPAVVLLPGDNARNRVGVLRDVARGLAALQHPVLRFDYPGWGFSPTDAPGSRKELLPIVLEAVERFRTLTSCASIAVSGTCLGARGALMVAARIPGVTNTVAVGSPIRPRRPAGGKLAAGLATVDRIGGPMAERLAKLGSKTKVDGEGWQKGLLEDLDRAAERGRVELVFGGADEFYSDFLELSESGELPTRTLNRLVVTVLEGQQLRGLMSVEHHDWVRETLIRSLAMEHAGSPIEH